ncbi:hypothetical protein [Limnobacter parvus]|uniref:Aspartyl-phosphate phosphatase Spo0E family protein n=1 Tax=Limnobacter parvus TaxID=2939690 RepID=A0ABT1XIN5_9BURK|nr:hypothetical protein [Limnobacter parvus]MCR2747127.1 hypothetical protein [Limnobacter parvus]
MQDLIKELKVARQSIERAIDTAKEKPVAERTVKDLKEVQSIIESVIRRNKAEMGKHQ